MGEKKLPGRYENIEELKNLFEKIAGNGGFVLFTLRLFENAQRVKRILRPPKSSLLFKKK